MVVRATVDIALGIVTAPSECWQRYGMCIDALSREVDTNFDQLPLLSSERKALTKYQQQWIHPLPHFRCRHFLESLGSGTFVAFLRCPHLFIQTTQAFKDITDQTMPDFVICCRRNLISLAGQRNSCRMFDVNRMSDEGSNTLADIDPPVVAQQALWGDRGPVCGFSACTNHIEAFHALCDRKLGQLRNLVAKFSVVLDAAVTEAHL